MPTLVLCSPRRSSVLFLAIAVSQAKDLGKSLTARKPRPECFTEAAARASASWLVRYHCKARPKRKAPAGEPGRCVLPYEIALQRVQFADFSHAFHERPVDDPARRRADAR